MEPRSLPVVEAPLANDGPDQLARRQGRHGLSEHQSTLSGICLYRDFDGAGFGLNPQLEVMGFGASVHHGSALCRQNQSRLLRAELLGRVGRMQRRHLCRTDRRQRNDNYRLGVFEGRRNTEAQIERVVGRQ